MLDTCDTCLPVCCDLDVADLLQGEVGEEIRMQARCPHWKAVVNKRLVRYWKFSSFGSFIFTERKKKKARADLWVNYECMIQVHETAKQLFGLTDVRCQTILSQHLAPIELY